MEKRFFLAHSSRLHAIIVGTSGQQVLEEAATRSPSKIQKQGHGWMCAVPASLLSPFYISRDPQMMVPSQCKWVFPHKLTNQDNPSQVCPTTRWLWILSSWQLILPIMWHYEGLVHRWGELLLSWSNNLSNTKENQMRLGDSVGTKQQAWSWKQSVGRIPKLLTWPPWHRTELCHQWQGLLPSAASSGDQPKVSNRYHLLFSGSG